MGPCDSHVTETCTCDIEASDPDLAIPSGAALLNSTERKVVTVGCFAGRIGHLISSLTYSDVFQFVSEAQTLHGHKDRGFKGMYLHS